MKAKPICTYSRHEIFSTPAFVQKKEKQNSIYGN